MLTMIDRRYGQWGGLRDHIVYAGLLTGLRISAVDGTAFLDACAGLVPYADGNHRIEIYDSAGRQLVGYLSAQGAGETLSGIELVTNGGFEGVYVGGLAPNWTKSGTGTLTESATAHGGSAAQSIASTNNCSVYQFVAKTSGRLYYHSVWKKITGVCSHAVRIADSVDGAILDGTSVDADYAALSGYLTANTTANHTIYLGPLVTSSSGTVLFDDLSIQQVTAPSTDGVLIVSTKGGAVPNFAAVNASFTLNAASYQVIVRKVR